MLMDVELDFEEDAMPFPEPLDPPSLPDSPLMVPPSMDALPRVTSQKPVLKKPKTSLRYVIAKDFIAPTRKWHPIPCASAQDARNRILRRQILEEASPVERKRLKLNVLKPQEPLTKFLVVQPKKSKRPVVSPKDSVPKPPVIPPKDSVPPVSSLHLPKRVPSKTFFKPRGGSNGSRVHMHDKCLVTVCIQPSRGYTVTNGVKSLSYDYGLHEQKLIEDLTELKVGHLFTTDEVSHAQWKRLQDRLNPYHPYKTLKAIRLDIKKNNQKCVYCSIMCHRWMAIMGGMVHLLIVSLDPIPHCR